MRFSKRSRTLSIAGRRSSKSYTETTEVAAEERNALLGVTPPPAQMDTETGNPPLQDDPTQRILSALGCYQKALAKADAGAPPSEWADECVSQLVASIEIAFAQHWDNVRESLTDAARVLQTYEEADRANECVPFLQESYEALCLMVGDLIVGSTHAGVMEKWRSTYAQALRELEEAGLTLIEDDDEPLDDTPESSEDFTMEPSPDEDAFSARADAFFDEADDEEEAEFEPEESSVPERFEVQKERTAGLRLVGDDEAVPGVPEDEVGVFEEDDTEELLVNAPSEPPDSRIPFDMPPISENAFAADPGAALNGMDSSKQTDSQAKSDEDDHIIPFELPIGNIGAPMPELPALNDVIPEETDLDLRARIEDADGGGARLDDVPMPEEELNIVSPLGPDEALASPETDEFATRAMEQNGFDSASVRTFNGEHGEAEFVPDEPLSEEGVHGVKETPPSVRASQFDLPFETEREDACDSEEIPIETAPPEAVKEAPAVASAAATEVSAAPLPDAGADALNSLFRAARDAVSGGAVADAKLVALQLAANIAQLELEQGQTALIAMEQKRQRYASDLDDAESRLRAAGQSLEDKEAEFSAKEQTCRSTRETLTELRVKESAEARSIEELDKQIQELTAHRDEHARVKAALDERIEIAGGEENRLLAELEGLSETIEETRADLDQAQDDVARSRTGLEESTAAVANAETELARRREAAAGIAQVVRAIGGTGV